ncbi:MAG: hypothetical protein IKH52_06455, partial [Bacteroidaceae bacterium]|nr:hypothetical protein [Bacteroidaceae bacterium]
HSKVLVKLIRSLGHNRLRQIKIRGNVHCQFQMRNVRRLRGCLLVVEIMVEVITNPLQFLQ